jgi:membrane fusion protein
MNAEPRQTLFRQEVLEHRAERLHGDVHLAVPMSWQLIGYLLLAALITAVLLLLSASYARVETATGAIALDTGVVQIVPTRPGVVTALNVREGQAVQAGQPLVSIRAEEDLVHGATMPHQVLDAVNEQDRHLSTQGQLTLAAAAAQQQQLLAGIAGDTQEIASLDAQIIGQRRLVEVAENEFRSVQGVASRGFISQRDLEAREQTLLTRRQQLDQLQQSRAAKAASLAAARRAIAESGATAQAQVAGVLSSRAQLAQQRAQAEAAQGYTLNAPVAGTITALLARQGQPATTQQPIMIVLPAGGRPRVELFVPTTAAGFLSVGQEVRISVDAFPSDRFGTVTGRVSEISGTTIARQTSEGVVPVYLVTAELPQPWVIAFGRRQALQPGMTLTARIVTEQRSLFEWLFEPLFAVSGR